jgi:hypothetical protein
MYIVFSKFDGLVGKNEGDVVVDGVKWPERCCGDFFVVVAAKSSKY